MDKEMNEKIQNLLTGDPSEMPGEVVADTEPSTIVVTDELLAQQPKRDDPYEICVDNYQISEDESNARE